MAFSFLEYSACRLTSGPLENQNRVFPFQFSRFHSFVVFLCLKLVYLPLGRRNSFSLFHLNSDAGINKYPMLFFVIHFVSPLSRSWLGFLVNLVISIVSFFSSAFQSGSIFSCSFSHVSLFVAICSACLVFVAFHCLCFLFHANSFVAETDVARIFIHTFHVQVSNCRISVHLNRGTPRHLDLNALPRHVNRHCILATLEV